MFKFLKREKTEEGTEVFRVKAETPPDLLSEYGQFDINSGTWGFVSRWAESELQVLRAKNDKVTLDDTRTAVIRGRIKQLKALLKLQEEK